MDRLSEAKFDTHASKVFLFPVGGSCHDPEVVEVSSSNWVSNNRSKRKMGEVVALDLPKFSEADTSEVIILEDKSADKKNKQPVHYMENIFQHNVIGMPQHFIGPTTALPSESVTSVGPQNCAEEGSYYYLEDDTDSSIYDYEDDDPGDVFETNAYNMAAAFDHLDLPTGVEATVPWLQNFEPEKNIMSRTRDPDVKIVFKKFDTVQDMSDHYFNRGVEGTGPVMKPSKNWIKRIQHEWKVLENDLPDMIFVRVYEERLDLLRAVITGPAGTPYHDGLFFFDAFFPTNYPSVPPIVHYHSGGLRLNPNLYECGKVCLSLLGTWHGTGCERWDPDKSTMLQVLVSIQALVLNAKPYFNEPGFADSAGTYQGEKRSVSYNEESFLLSCKTMLYSLRRPPKNFEDLVAEHFAKSGRAVLVACNAYMRGAQVGCVDVAGVQDVDEGDKSSSRNFRSSLKALFEELLMEFTVKGADCADFLACKAKSEVKLPDTTLRL